MGGNYAEHAGVFLIQTLFGLYILAIMLRFLLQWVRADFYNPVSQFLVKITNPLLKPLRRLIPGFWGMDLAAIVLMLLLQMLELFLVGVVVGQAFKPLGVLLMSAGELLSLAVYVFMFAIIIQIILSWIQPGSYNPVIGLVNRIAEPLLAPARRLIPPISGLDLSPLAVLILLQLTQILLVSPVKDFGRMLAFQ